MNTCRTFSSIALFAAAMPIGSSSTYAQNGAVGIANPAKGITVDGDLSDWPEGLRTYPIERIESGDELKAHFRVAYNDVARLTATGHGGSSPMMKGKPSEPNMAASLHINAGNYAKFLTAVLQGKGLSAPTAKEMLRPQVKVPDHQGASWGLGLSIEETPFGVNYGHGGGNTGFSSRSLMCKDQGLGYVFLTLGPGQERRQGRSLPGVGNRILPQAGHGRHDHLRQG